MTRELFWLQLDMKQEPVQETQNKKSTLLLSNDESLQYSFLLDLCSVVLGLCSDCPLSVKINLSCCKQPCMFDREIKKSRDKTEMKQLLPTDPPADSSTLLLSSLCRKLLPRLPSFLPLLRLLLFFIVYFSAVSVTSPALSNDTFFS